MSTPPTGATPGERRRPPGRGVRAEFEFELALPDDALPTVRSPQAVPTWEVATRSDERARYATTRARCSR